jgi:hypothetical protein
MQVLKRAFQIDNKIFKADQHQYSWFGTKGVNRDLSFESQSKHLWFGKELNAAVVQFFSIIVSKSLTKDHKNSSEEPNPIIEFPFLNSTDYH